MAIKMRFFSYPIHKTSFFGLPNQILSTETKVGFSSQMGTTVITVTIIIFLAFFLPATINADEAASLLNFKQSSVSLDPKSSLVSWTIVAGQPPTPCKWAGISCSSTSGNVTGINLGNFGLVGRLNIADLMALSNLQFVDLHGNSFSGNLSHAVGVQTCSFATVDLSMNNFSDTVAGNFLSECSNLVQLNLSQNAIAGGVYPFVSSLQKLDLSHNKISDYGPYSSAISNCQSLTYLNLSNNAIAGEFLTVSSCKRLVSLDLSYNSFAGAFPVGFFPTLPPSLSDLYLTKNNFTGDISTLDFGTCGNLTTLFLSSNMLTGEGLPLSLANCVKMEQLDLSSNQLSGSIPASLGKMGNLKYLCLSNNKYSSDIPRELSSLCRSLVTLDLSGNSLTGGLPATFVGCSSIQTLNLGNNHLSIDFISTIVSTMPSLKYLLAPFNYIVGEVPLTSLKNSSSLVEIDLSSNNITGKIPDGFCPSMPSLHKIHLQNNYITGTLPPSLANCTALTSIDLSFNDLSGPIPPRLFSLPNIVELVMWANSFTGEIPDNLCEGTNPPLEMLILNYNMISGTIPPSITRCTNLIWLSLSGNRLTGEIPDSIGNLKNLSMLQLGNNSITGGIPPSISNCISLQWVDLFSNMLSGPIPGAFASTAGFVIQNPKLKGKPYAYLRNEGGFSCPVTGAMFEFSGVRTERFMDYPLMHACSLMRIYTGLTGNIFNTNGTFLYVDLSYNEFSGFIPDNMGNLFLANIISLGNNQLSGPIPRSFGGLKQIAVLDLSHNHLNGSIPSELGTLSFLHDLDLSNNNLTGPIPTTGQFSTMPASTFEGNPGLCGLPLSPCETAVPKQNLNPNTSGRKKLLGASVAIGIAISSLIIVILVFFLFKVKQNKKKDEIIDDYINSLPSGNTSTWKFGGVMEPLSVNVSTFEKPLKKLTFAHLLEATNGFSEDSMIGSGGFGEVYKARLKDGNIVAIKKLVHATSQGDREFMAEMETIGKIKHQNLVPLLGYCKVGEERLLVYEYMKHGSLEFALENRGRKGASDLNWSVRRNIAIGSARGLAFLHHSCIPHIIHRDMKSSNVLLGEGLEARVSDFGMARLMNAVDTHLSVSSLAGTPGYVPPEYYQSFRCTTKGDVYSFGVVLLELLSGKKPIDASEFGENNLAGWAKQLVKENRQSEILDSELKGGSPSDEAEMNRFLKIACDCLEDRPLRRPNMIQVLTVFKEIIGDSADSDILEGLTTEGMIIDESREKIIP